MTPSPQQNDPGPPSVSVDQAEIETTGLPVLCTWRRMYLFVFGCFVACVAFLVVLQRMFS